ncbi:hypothetical protein NO2_0652 [Candidatus Termititenax persephonae]|uniref:SLH domain-containing protein n=1 Tax=Candidatus Termititenax persephonae TaxID=2218525 RepID=A0A388TH68_9BACT|nr:hypothetical protein NO2_0652 [Candidatus Termititenax persephonae]
MKKFAQALLLFSLFSIGFGAPETTATVNFKDMSEDFWAAGAVYRMVGLGVVRGYPDGTLRGSEAASRYDTLVYLNNLSLSMEALMDKKLQDYGRSNARASVVSPKEFLNLQQEVDDLRAQVAAWQGPRTVVYAQPAGSTSNTEMTGFILPDLLKDNLVIDSYYVVSSETNTGNYDLAFPRLMTRADFHLGRDYGLTGFEITLKRSYTSLAAWTGKELTPSSLIKFQASAGPGQVVDVDRQVINNPSDSLGARFGWGNLRNGDVWGLTLGVEQSYADTDITAPHGGKMLVSQTTWLGSFDFSVWLPLFNTGNIGYVYDKYSGKSERDASGNITDVRTDRYLTELRFDFAENRYFSTRLINEMHQNDYDIDIAGLAQYYDAQLLLGGLLNNGLDLGLMYAYRGQDFGANKIGEDVPNVNFLGYASCGYPVNDIFGENLVPNAAIITETGVKLTGYLYRKDLTLDFVYIFGQADPDPDADVETKYLYDQYGVRGNWNLLANSTFYVGWEKLFLYNSDLSDDDKQWEEELVKFGLRFAF